MYTENKFGFNFLECPDRIFNCDESGVEFDAVSKIVYAEKGNFIITMAPEAQFWIGTSQLRMDISQLRIDISQLRIDISVLHISHTSALHTILTFLRFVFLTLPRFIP